MNATAGWWEGDRNLRRVSYFQSESSALSSFSLVIRGLWPGPTEAHRACTASTSGDSAPSRPTEAHRVWTLDGHQEGEALGNAGNELPDASDHEADLVRVAREPCWVMGRVITEASPSPDQLRVRCWIDLNAPSVAGLGHRLVVLPNGTLSGPGEVIPTTQVEQVRLQSSPRQDRSGDGLVAGQEDIRLVQNLGHGVSPNPVEEASQPSRSHDSRRSFDYADCLEEVNLCMRQSQGSLGGRYTDADNVCFRSLEDRSPVQHERMPRRENTLERRVRLPEPRCYPVWCQEPAGSGILRVCVRNLVSPPDQVLQPRKQVHFSHAHSSVAVSYRGLRRSSAPIGRPGLSSFSANTYTSRTRMDSGRK
jgi:hypothetical protein